MTGISSRANFARCCPWMSEWKPARQRDNKCFARSSIAAGRTTHSQAEAPQTGTMPIFLLWDSQNGYKGQLMNWSFTLELYFSGYRELADHGPGHRWLHRNVSVAPCCTFCISEKRSISVTNGSVANRPHEFLYGLLSRATSSGPSGDHSTPAIPTKVVFVNSASRSISIFLNHASRSSFGVPWPGHRFRT